MQKGRKQQKKVQSIREMLAMRFRISNERGLKLRKSETSFFTKFVDRFRGKIRSSELDEELLPLFSLKFIEKLNEQCILIGNEYQLSAVGISCMNDYIQASSNWSIAEDDLITNLFVSPKVRSLFIVCSHKLHLYSYCLESSEEAPIKQQTLTFSENICGIYVLKRAIIIVLLQTKFEVFEIEYAYGKSKMTKKRAYSYFEGKDSKTEHLELISIPEEQGNMFQIFFKDTSGTSIFQIYSLKIECLSPQQIHVSTIHKFCDVPERYIKTLQISHYRSDIYLVYVGLQLYAVRNNYFLDSIITNTSKLRSFIKEFSSNFFFLYHKDRFDLYRYELNEKVKPQRFEVECIDTIPVTKPAGSFFFDIKQLGEHLIFVFQQPTPADSSELCFWLGIGDQIDAEAKIDKLYPSTSDQIESIDKDSIQDKIEMALQIGYNIDSAYLQLWNRSHKSSKKDYDFLIATQNYEMIASEIEAKFKKASLKYSQVKDVMQRSLLMLREKIKRAHETPEHIRQFAACHFLYCKYLMFQRLKLLENPQCKIDNLTINIQDYYHLIGIEIIKYLFELLGQYLTSKNRKTYLFQVKILLTQFSLIFRIRYHEILAAIVKVYKKDLFTLIQGIPELLPIQVTKNSDALCCGAWTKIDLKNSEDYIILDDCINFQNRKNIEDFIQSKFFKVYHWHSHGAFAESKSVLTQKLSKYNSEQLFILFYEQLFYHKEAFKPDELNQFIAFLENNYPLLPKNLIGRFRFYEALYESFRSYHEAQRKKFMSTVDFLRLSEDELFEIYFQEERAKKGIFLLKEVEPIYERTVIGGRQLFLKSMFRFFQGDRSSWSDLKIVLNKFNNQKEDFHKRSYEVFEVMVKAILQKVRVGSENAEAGLAEVLSYLENIPFPLEQSSLLESLVSIQQIHEEQQILKQIKINMTLRQVLQNGEYVIFKMIQNQIRKYKVTEITDCHELKLFAYKILTEVNYRKSNIYVDKHANYPLKCFVMILMQNEAHIPACKELLFDDFLVKAFSINEKLIENIVTYLYRKKLSINPVYEENKGYIDAIVNILEENNIKRRFLELSEIYAGIFSTMRFKMRYPFFKSYYPTVDEVERVIEELDREELMNIEYEELFDLIIEFKSLGQDMQNIVDTKRNRFANHSGEEKLKIMKHELYTAFFMNYMKQGLIKECALKIASEIMEMDTKYKIYNIIVPVFLIEIAQKEMIDQLIDPLLQLISYYFNCQEELQGFVNWIFTREEGFTNQELLDQFLLLKEEKKEVPIFDPNNPLFSCRFREQLQKYTPSEQALKFNQIFNDIWNHIKQTREEFVKEKVYSTLYRLMLHNPYVLAEYINRKQGGINVCSLRALFTLIGVECIFDLQKLLELGESIFSILMVELKSKILLEDLLEIYSRGEKYKDELKYTDEYISELIKLEAEDLIGNSILSFRNKFAYFISMDKEALEFEKEKNFKLLLENKEKYLSSHLNYPFQDRDKQYALPEQSLVLFKKHLKNSKFQFDDSKQRSELCEHLNYLIQPVFKKEGNQAQKTMAEFYLKMNKKLVKKHPSKMKSFDIDIADFSSKMELPISFPFTVNNLDGNSREPERLNNLQKSQSLKVLADEDEEEDESRGINFGQGFIDFLPDFKIVDHQEEEIEVLSESIRMQISLCLEKRKAYDRSQLPSSLEPTQKQDVFEKMVEKIYSLHNYPLQQRIQLIWDVKKKLLGPMSVEKRIEEITFRLGSFELINSLLCKIEDIFSTVIYTQDFTQEALLQLIRENMNDNVQHQQDTLKSAEIIGYVFNSQHAKESILMMFLVKLCRSYALEQDERQQNHLKDEIIFIQQNIGTKMVASAIESYSKSRNEDLRTTGKVLQYFKNYHHHHHNVLDINV